MNHIKEFLKDLIYLILFQILLYFNLEISKELTNTGLALINIMLSICFFLGAFWTSLGMLWGLVCIIENPVVRLENSVEILEGINLCLDKVKNFVQFRTLKLKWKIYKHNLNKNGNK